MAAFTDGGPAAREAETLPRGWKGAEPGSEPAVKQGDELAQRVPCLPGVGDMGTVGSWTLGGVLGSVGRPAASLTSPLEASSPSALGVTVTNVSKHCQVPPGGETASR